LILMPINIWAAMVQIENARHGLGLVGRARAILAEADKAREEARRLHAITLELLKGRD
jgi:hypothetical protein